MFRQKFFSADQSIFGSFIISTTTMKPTLRRESFTQFPQKMAMNRHRTAQRREIRMKTSIHKLKSSCFFVNSNQKYMDFMRLDVDVNEYWFKVKINKNQKRDDCNSIEYDGLKKNRGFFLRLSGLS